MLQYFADRPTKSTVPITALGRGELAAWLKKQPARTRKWLSSTSFGGEPSAFSAIPDGNGQLSRVVVVVGDEMSPWDFADLPARLPVGRYRLDPEPEAPLATAAAFGWAMGTYRFTEYSAPTSELSTLVWPKHVDRDRVERDASAAFMVRDLINTPAEDMGPEELASAGRKLVEEFGGECVVVVGDSLLKKNYPAIYDVGRASERVPRLIDLRWGDKSHPRVTLVGKGICFDTGGLNMKGGSNMALMKKDMGGGAHVLGLARMVMMAKLPVRLRVLVPAAENSVSGSAIRPGDVLQTRKGLTVEVGNTDAEGRLVLCDALAEADSEDPEVIIDFATLTGAARVATGTELPVLFCNDEHTAAELLEHSRVAGDPMWRLPLYQPYRRHLKSLIADTGNVASSAYGGAIVAALFLEQFVHPERVWIHLDLMAWNLDTRPGRPAGGEAQALRAVFALLDGWYPAKGPEEPEREA